MDRLATFLGVLSTGVEAGGEAPNEPNDPKFEPPAGPPAEAEAFFLNDSLIFFCPSTYLVDKVMNSLISMPKNFLNGDGVVVVVVVVVGVATVLAAEVGVTTVLAPEVGVAVVEAVGSSRGGDVEVTTLVGAAEVLEIDG